MLKAIAYLLIGAVPAAIVTWPFVADRSSPRASSAFELDAGSQLYAPAARPAAATNPAAIAFRMASEIDDAATLERALAEAMSEPFSIDRNARIEALFGRLAELDLRRALRFAQLPAFDRRLVANVFRAWAEFDREAALAQLGAVGNADTRIEVAVALLDAVGTDPAAVDEIASLLPEVQRIDFQAEVLARRARADRNGALAAALALRDPAARNTAIQRIGSVWTEQDPLGALQHTESLPRELQAAYRDSVAVEWARVDVNGFLDYADTLPRLDTLHAGLAQAMAVDPMRLFEVASRHPPVPIGAPFPANITVDRTAFTAVANADPQWGIAFLETIKGDTQRYQSYRAALAETWGRVDPKAALEWVRTFDPPLIGLQGTIVWSAAMVDMDMAVDWYLDFQNTVGQLPPAGVPGNLATFVSTDPRRAEYATRLRARKDDPAAMQLLERVTAIWVQTDPESALDWMLEGDGTAVDPQLASSIAGRLANRDAALAASYLERMPPEIKSAWLEQVAGPYARQDPAAAASWIAQFRDDPSFERIMMQVVQTSAQTDPEGAARMLLVAPETVQARVTASVASAWAQQDLAGAARWAAGLTNTDTRASALTTVVGAWATRDPQQAQRWVLSLPRGETRDRGLQTLVSRFSRPDFNVPIDRSLFDAVENDQLRQAMERMTERAR